MKLLVDMNLSPSWVEPDGDQLKITLKGDLAGMLSAARDSKRSPDIGDLSK